MSVIENLVLQALAFQSQGKLAEALNALEAALSMAEPEGFMRIFVDEGLPMQQLLKVAAGNKIAHEYIAKLLDGFENVRTVTTSPSSPRS